MAKEFHVIVADDDEDDQIVIKEAFSAINKKNLQVTSVYNGRQLLEYLSRQGRYKSVERFPDLIILDINMPVIDGCEAFKKIKSDRLFRNIPVFVLTTLRDVQKIENCEGMGADIIYRKPNDFSGYKQILEKILN